MKTTGRRSLVLYILLAGFVFGMSYLLFNVFTQGGKWIAQPYNGHIYADTATAELKDIVDRNNVLLATSEDGSRIYSENESIRKSTLHTLGDSSGYIGTGIQSTMLYELVGYNPITGLNAMPLPVDNLKLSLDSSLNSIAYSALNGKNGAVLLYNYETGEILCKVSTPTYDPMNVPANLSEDAQYEGVFLDNTISSSYTPGSIFKTVTAASMMENMADWDSKIYNCQGEMSVGADTITCLASHGDVNINEAYGQSCNIFFANAAMELGDEKLTKTAEDFGFNESFNLGEFGTAKSTIDLTNVEQVNLGWAGVGQYTTLTNPMHMLMLAGAVANGGEYVHPTVLFNNPTSKTRLMDSETANNLSKLMRQTVSNYYGDYLFPADMQIAAKTGTAEVGADKEPNSWIIGFSQNEDTPYAFSIVVEEGGFGLSTAGSIAASLLSQLESN